jgi:hypothetical protein
MKFDPKTLTPWADFLRMVQNARSLEVTMDGNTLPGDVDVSLDDDGVLMFAFEDTSRRKVRRK